MFLQMQYAVFDFLGPTLIPELSPDVTAGTSGYIHLGLIVVMTIGTLPNQPPSLFIFDDLDLSIPSTDLAVIALGIQLSIDDIIIDELHNLEHCRNIILHIRYFNVADCRN